MAEIKYIFKFCQNSRRQDFCHLVCNTSVTNQCFFKIRHIANFEKISTQRRVEVLLTVLLIALGERFQAWGNAPLFLPSAEGKFPFLDCETDV